MLLRGKRIFIVEDKLNTTAIAQTLLEREGAKVLVERWGIETPLFLKIYGPMDLIMLDLTLPGNVSGFDVFNELRQIHQFTRIPVVAVSAADAATAIPQAQALGFAGFISKPVDLLLFAKQIERILSGESLWIAAKRNDAESS